MRKNPLPLGILKSTSFLLLFLFTAFYGNAQSPQLRITDFVLFGGNANCPNGAQTPCNSPGCAVQLGSSSSVSGGSVGSYRLVKTTGTVTITGNVYSGGTVQLSNGNKVTGKITAANSTAITTPAFTAGSNSIFSGNIDINGNITVSGGTVSGKVTHPSGTTYTGPTPLGGNIVGNPSLPLLPDMPPIAIFPSAGVTDITTSKTITPGAYRNISLSGNKTITLSGPGTYIFKSIKNSGSTNNFVFDFKGSSTGNFIIYIHGDANLCKVSASMTNGGSATRIFTEVHGNGTGDDDDPTASFRIANGSSSNSATKWLGTVWAPYAAINIGSGTGNCSITGALWSGTQVNIQSGVSIIYAPFLLCSTPNAKAGNDKSITCDIPTVTLDGSSTTAGAQYSWTSVGGTGVFVSGANTATPVVSAAGKYVLQVSVNGGCSATDTVVVTDIPCVIPYYPPPANGKVGNLIGAELNSLYLNFGLVTDSAKTIFILKGDSVMIDVISRQGQFAALLSLLQTSDYGITDLIDNGPNSGIITGKYPIANLRKLDSLPILIDYCRPLFPGINNTGIATTQGDAVMRTDFLRNGYKLNGDSIKVGVISDSYNTLANNPASTDVSNGDLPGTGNPVNGTPVQVLGEYPFGRRSDEGRAMLQIIHDIAPKATLAFRTGFVSPGDMALGIRQLKQASCDVIVDDVTFITEPFFRDGVVTQAVNEVSQQGVTYFTSAGNFGNKAYESNFNATAAPAGIIGSAHNFGGGDIFQNISLKPGTYTIVLQWDDDFYSLGQGTGTQNDLDIYLTNNSGVTLFGFNRNNIGGDPVEVLPFTVTTNTQTNILVTRNSGNASVRFKYIIYRGDATINEFNSGESTIAGHANAEGCRAFLSWQLGIYQ